MNFKKIKDFPRYEISDTGRVYDIHKDRYLKSFNNGKYKTVQLRKGDIYVGRAIQRLVAEAFICRKSKCYCVKHKDGNRKNNYVDNLYWAEKKHYKPTFIGKTSKILLKGVVR